MYKCMVKTYNLFNSIWQTHATVDLCISVFSTDMHTLVWVKDQVDLCADINYLLSVHSRSTMVFVPFRHVDFSITLVCPFYCHFLIFRLMT